jgi:hypothetical protein
MRVANTSPHLGGEREKLPAKAAVAMGRLRPAQALIYEDADAAAIGVAEDDGPA